MAKMNYLKRHRSRLLLEGVLKATLFALVIGFGTNFLVALAEWLFGFGNVLIAIAAGAAAAVISGVVIYFARLRPEARDIAHRVDRLGLEERLITMMELEGDDSYIAKLQREDTERQLSMISKRRVRLSFSKLLIVLAVVTALLGSSMTTVVGLAHEGVIPDAPGIIAPDDPMALYVSVSYMVDEGGEIIGEPDQLIAPGSDAATVVAVPEDGWMFIGWDDGFDDPERTDTNITEDVEFVALFVELEEVEPEDGGDGEGGEDGSPSDGEGDAAQDAPNGGGEGGSENEGSTDSDKDSEGNDGEQNGEDGADGESSSGNEGAEGAGGGGKWEDSNQFIDGNTYYKDQLEMFYEWAKEIFEQNGEIPPELREFFENYLGSL